MRLFKIFGKWSVQANIHTHVRNEVTLVWGSLRLAPINMAATGFYSDGTQYEKTDQINMAHSQE